MSNEYRIFQPKEYYGRFLEKEVRPDNRELGEFRPMVLSIGCISTAEGSALVKLGNTTVICGVKGEMAEPKLESPKAGYIVPNVDLSAMCSPQFRPGPPVKEAQVLSKCIADIISHSQCINLEDLCIIPGKLVWVLYVDLICLDFEGNVLDACVIALTAALKNTALPTVLVDEETQQIKTDIKHQIMLKPACSPVSTSYAVFDDSVLLVDPTSEEENLAKGIVTVTTDGESICFVHKAGGRPLTNNQMKVCFHRALERHTEACKLIDETLCSVDR